MKKRIEWLDIGKGLGILFVMLGHTSIPSPIKTYIYTFHMPLFFFLSGYLFNLNKIPSLKVFMAKRMKTLVLPYLFFSFIAYLWFVILFKSGQVSYHDNILKPLVGAFVGIRKSVWTVESGPLWFLNCLFFTELLFYFISKIGHTKKRIGLMVLFISIIGCFYNKTIGKPLFWNVDVTMISVGFYGIGYFYKEYKMRVERFFTIKSFFVCLFVNVLTGHLNFVHSGTRVDLYESSLGNVYLFYISALTGIFAFVFLIKHIKANKILIFLGQNSLIFLAFHQKIVYSFFDLIFQNTVLYSSHLLQGIVYTTLAAILITPSVIVINRYLPFMIGRRKAYTKRRHKLHYVA